MPERLEWLLHGRSPWKWGESVRLSSGAISRLMTGRFPDPEKLVPACRIENLSLTWLIEGRGMPYCVATPADDVEAASILGQVFADEPQTNLLVAYTETSYTVIVWMPVQAQTQDGKPYNYNATTILGGGVAGPDTMEVIEANYSFTGVEYCRALRLERDKWRALASGLMGNHDVFGEGGLLEQSTRGHAPPITLRNGWDQVREYGSIQWQDSDERAAMAILRALEKPDRSAALRMLKGLRDIKR